MELAGAWHAAAREVLPRLASDPALIEHLQRAAASGGLVAHAGELALAWAVSRGDADAIARFERDVMPEADVAARKLDREPAFVDEVRQLVRVRLLVADGAAPPRIAAYRGTGPLRAWVAVAALRVALNAKRAGKRARAIDDVLSEIAELEPDPELRHLKMLYRTEFRAALGAALSALPERERAVLRLRFVEGLELAHIGRLYSVHESTASRWVSAALERVAGDTKRGLISRLSIGADGADSIARMVASHLDLSIARLLQ